MLVRVCSDVDDDDGIDDAEVRVLLTPNRWVNGDDVDESSPP